MGIFNFSVDIESFVTPSSASNVLNNIFSAAFEQFLQIHLSYLYHCTFENPRWLQFYKMAAQIISQSYFLLYFYWKLYYFLCIQSRILFCKNGYFTIQLYLVQLPLQFPKFQTMSCLLLQDHLPLKSVLLRTVRRPSFTSNSISD